jgi:hypothetical protein
MDLTRLGEDNVNRLNVGQTQQGNVQWSISYVYDPILLVIERNRFATRNIVELLILLLTKEHGEHKMKADTQMNVESGTRPTGHEPFWSHCCHTLCVLLYMVLLANQIDNTCACLPSLLVLISISTNCLALFPHSHFFQDLLTLEPWVLKNCSVLSVDTALYVTSAQYRW